ncbi:hypothetical protein PTSG_09973 [Salpingoeca rosetta]|uniref:Pentacotripeptide-repeat region of PRORP domain-containing protein n=1 Tax=Salpingoeca rosetta (strain ATCC 50818 / BSB-021) TaxID=946362 RepID=F2UNP6_SALR5|nr:uncharacterized protein PTSG_09973 [Salpingoeca rosetta]EGD79251.1 hypothetical protein PTSG_09973 [Salpingoeca rosetta]|eukprot:XP_004989336.1 hypothetical protein PTSG_09973 [Salpingoeca rosetta]
MALVVAGGACRLAAASSARAIAASTPARRLVSLSSSSSSSVSATTASPRSVVQPCRRQLSTTMRRRQQQQQQQQRHSAHFCNHRRRLALCEVRAGPASLISQSLTLSHKPTLIAPLARRTVTTTTRVLESESTSPSATKPDADAASDLSTHTTTTAGESAGTDAKQQQEQEQEQQQQDQQQQGTDAMAARTLHGTRFKETVGGGQGKKRGKPRRPNVLKDELKGLSPVAAVRHVIEAAERGRKVQRAHWHMALEACSRVGFYKPAESVFEAMEQHGVKPNPFTYRLLIHVYGVAKHLDKVLHFYNKLQQLQHDSDHPTFRLRIKDFNTVLEAISHCGALREFEHVYAQMRQAGAQPDDKTLVVAMACYSKAGVQRELDYAFEQYVQQQDEKCLPLSPYVFNAYMSHYSRACNPTKCREVLDLWRSRGSEENWYLVNSYMSSYALSGDCEGCERVFRQEVLDRSGGTVTPSVLNTLMNAYVRAGRVEDARNVLALFEQHRLRPEVTTFMILLQALAQQGNVAAVRALMTHMERLRLNAGARAYAMLLRAMCVRGDPPQALEATFDKMLHSKIKPLPLSFESLYLAYANVGDAAGCESTLRRIRLLGLPLTTAIKQHQGMAS